MKRLYALLRASMTEGMNLFKINTKNKKNSTKIVLPIALALVLMITIYSYADGIIKELVKINMGFAVLSIFVLLTSILTIIEGIYKSSSLLFNCKDDNLLLSLPIKRSTVLFIRVFKFYVFELIYNSIFLIPSMVAYAVYLKPGVSYYVVSLIGVFLFPIIPILISVLIGAFITYVASKFKGKNIVQTIVTILLIIGVMYFSYGSESLAANIADKAVGINDFITKVYYPAWAYISLVTKFDLLKLLLFIVINISIFMVVIFLIGKLYFNINSDAKKVKIGKRKKAYVIKSNGVIKSLIKKDIKRFVNSTVYITNAGFGLVLFIIGCILLVVKYDNIIPLLSGDLLVYITDNMAVILLAMIIFTSFMTSITSSMISIEGKSFNILKSMPIKSLTIVTAKILTAAVIMVPCLLIGDIIVFTKFSFTIIDIILIIMATILFPLISGTIGIIINLKYPKMDAKNDTEVVKQSMSSLIATFSGMGLSFLNFYLLYTMVVNNIARTNILLIFVLSYTIIYNILVFLLNKNCDKWINNISI